jgi:hypothetical protein
MLACESLALFGFQVRLRESKDHNTRSSDLAGGKWLKTSPHKVRGWFRNANTLKLLHIGQFSHFCSHSFLNTYLSAHSGKKLTNLMVKLLT